jgi:hypothetical protein
MDLRLVVPFVELRAEFFRNLLDKVIPPRLHTLTLFVGPSKRRRIVQHKINAAIAEPRQDNRYQVNKREMEKIIKQRDTPQTQSMDSSRGA